MGEQLRRGENQRKLGKAKVISKLLQKREKRVATEVSEEQSIGRWHEK